MSYATSHMAVRRKEGKMVPEVISDRPRMENVDELLKILFAAKMLREGQQVDILLNRMSEMEKNYSSVLQELADVKEQLGGILDRAENGTMIQQHKGVFTQLAEQMDNKIAESYQKLQEVKSDLNAKAKQVVQKFRDSGVAALNNVCEFLGIKEKLIAMRDNARSLDMDMQNSIEKIDKIETELGSAVSHLKNVGRTIAGKESPNAADHGQNKLLSKIFALVRQPYINQQSKYAERAEKLDKAIEKFNSLEKKASVLEKLSANKQELSANDGKNAVDHEKKREENVR